MAEPPRSQHPADRLIRDLIVSRRAASDDEVSQILDRLATASFSERLTSVRAEFRGRIFRGRTLRSREPSIWFHLFERVALDAMWSQQTTEDDYIADLCRVARSSRASLAVYWRRGGPMAFAFAPTVDVVPSARLGAEATIYTGVFYSADWGTISSGYQFTGLDEVSIPEEVRWLKHP